MAIFLSPLCLQLIDEIDYANMAGGDRQRASWRLLSDLKFESDVLGLYVVEAGFDTDLASTPRVPGAALFLGLANKAAVLHDHAYRAGVLSKEAADALFLEAMDVDRIPGREIMHAAVRALGEPSRED